MRENRWADDLTSEAENRVRACPIVQPVSQCSENVPRPIGRCEKTTYHKRNVANMLPGDQSMLIRPADILRADTARFVPKRVCQFIVFDSMHLDEGGDCVASKFTYFGSCAAWPVKAAYISKADISA